MTKSEQQTWNEFGLVFTLCWGGLILILILIIIIVFGV